MTDISDSTAQVSAEIDHILEQIPGCMRTDPKKAKELSEEVIRLSEKHGLTHKEANGLVWYSHAVSILAGAPEAISSARKAIELLSDSTDKLSLARAHSVLGNCLSMSFSLPEALAEYAKAMDFFKELEDKGGESAILNSTGNTYSLMGLHDKAFSAYSKALEIVRGTDKSLNRAAAMNNLATLLIRKDDPAKAEAYLEQSLAINRDAGRRKGEGLCLLDLGRVKAALGDYEDAEKYYRDSIVVFQDISSDQYLYHSLFMLSELKEKLGQVEGAEKLLIQGIETSKSSQSPRKIAAAKFNLASFRIRMGSTDVNETELTEYLQNLTDSGEDLNEKTKIYSSLSKLNVLKSDYRKALEYYIKKSEVDQQISTMDRENDVIRVRLRTEFQQSEKEKLELKKANKELSEALDRIKKLSGLLPMCASCKKIRNDSGYWEQIEEYIAYHSDAVLSHSLCPECAERMFPGMTDRNHGNN